MDETGAKTAMTRPDGRAPWAQRVKGSVPADRKSVTLISGLRLSGVMAPLAFDGAADTPAFESYDTHPLAPQLQPRGFGGLGQHQDPPPHCVLAERKRSGIVIGKKVLMWPDRWPIEATESFASSRTRSGSFSKSTGRSRCHATSTARGSSASIPPRSSVLYAIDDPRSSEDR